jgi:cyclophilin family peptidyl-prolyl cis-trans isomerase
MRTPSNHHLFALLSSAFLVWNPPVGGSPDAGRGPVTSVARTDDNLVPNAGHLSRPAAAAQVPAPQSPSGQVPAVQPAPGNPVVVISTSLGDITLELFKDRAPVSVENFLQYANEGFYADTIFHRVKKGFMIQGGGYTASLVEKPARPPIQNEATNGLHNARGTVGMARRAPLRSATSQFYINVVDNRSLDHTGFSPSEFGYAVFGRVLDGMDVVDRIVAVPTRTTADMEDVPTDPVIIKGVRVVK